jgi:hypothetical protein
MDTTYDLDTPLAEGGVPAVHFFNGRLLSAHDLRREQEARRIADGCLGQAIGAGVAFGLEVAKHPDSTPGNPRVTVKAGLALSRSGHALQVKAREVVINLVRRSKLAEGAGGFTQCAPLQGGTYVAGPGVYVLTIAPGAVRNGKVPTNGLETYGGSCNTDAVIETVQFRLLEASAARLGVALPGRSAPEISRFRNAVAHRCFGLTPPSAWAEAGAGAEPADVAALLGAGALSPCDVPLAALYWTLEDGIVFVDAWSVRRRIVRPSAAGAWSLPADDWRVAAGEAMLFQFRDQLAALMAPAGDVSAIAARDHFVYLPPAGIVPLPADTSAASAAIGKFFTGLAVRQPSLMEGARLEPLFRDSYAYPPIVLASGEMMWLFSVRENRDAVSRKPQPPRPYLVFTTSHMPHPAGARFDAGRWDQSSFGLAG